MLASVQTVGDCPHDRCEMLLPFAGDASEIMRTALVLDLFWLGLDRLQNG